MTKYVKFSDAFFFISNFLLILFINLLFEKRKLFRQIIGLQGSNPIIVLMNLWNSSVNLPFFIILLIPTKR
jgi:hypothetical protein